MIDNTTEYSSLSKQERIESKKE